MNIFGIGPLEIIFVLIIGILVLGPEGMVEAGKKLGQFMRSIIHSSWWKNVRQGVTEIQHLPQRLIREAELEELNQLRKLTEEEIIQTLSSLVKKARESIDQFQKGHRTDLVEKEKAELELILSFMPRQMGKEELEDFVDQTIKELGAKDMKDFGPVMKTIMVRLKGKAEGKTVNEVVKERLSRS